MTLPNFVVVGVAKAGTTSVSAYAAQHPEVFMSPVKETNYFALYGQKPDFRGPGAASIVNRGSVHTRRQYEALFGGVRGEQAIGEASPRYMTNPDAARRIRSDIPECRLVVGLRQPADRAFAAWTWARMAGRETHPFEEAIERADERQAANWAWGDYLGRGFYAVPLERYLDLFPRDQIHVYLFDEFKSDPAGAMRSIYRFLGVDPLFVPDVDRRHNRSGVITNPILQKLWELSSRPRDRLGHHLPKRLRVSTKNWLNRQIQKPRFDPELRRRLTDRYRADILRTQDLIGRDLSRWLEG